ncbi:MAG: sugar ABC transporter substrate-binding protein [Solirubrobacteraceae bacterium]
MLLLAMLCAALLAASAASAGTGHSSSHSSAVTQAKKVVAQAEKPPTWQGPTAKVNLKKVKGKSVYYVSLTQEIPALHEWGTVMAQQLSDAGVKTTTCDGKGTPADITTCLQQALAAKPNLIIGQGLDTQFIASYMKKAKAAGIPFVNAQNGNPNLSYGSTAEVSENYPLIGKVMAAWFVATAGCAKANPQIVTTTSSREPSMAEVKGIQSGLKQLCPQLHAPSVQNVLIPAWPTSLPTLTRSLITRNPSLHFLLPLYDGMAIYMLPAISGLSSAKNTVKVASSNATPVVMKDDLAKPGPLAADVGEPNQWIGAAMADQVLRALAGQAPVKSENIPVRLFTRQNIGSINLNKDESTWYGKVNPTCLYHKLWGLSCGS